MVDLIGPKGSTPNARIAPVLGAAAAAKIASAIATPEQQMQASHPVGQLAQELAAKPPIDATASIGSARRSATAASTTREGRGPVVVVKGGGMGG